MQIQCQRLINRGNKIIDCFATGEEPSDKENVSNIKLNNFSAEVLNRFTKEEGYIEGIGVIQKNSHLV